MIRVSLYIMCWTMGHPQECAENEPHEQAELRVSYKNYVQPKQQSGSVSRTAQKPGFSTACIPGQTSNDNLAQSIYAIYARERSRRLSQTSNKAHPQYALNICHRRRPPRSRGSARVIKSSSAKVCGKPLDVFPRTQIPAQVHSRYVNQKERVPADGMICAWSSLTIAIIGPFSSSSSGSIRIRRLCCASYASAPSSL